MTNGGYVLVLPETQERETIRLAHSSLMGGHLGVRKTMQRIANDFFFPRMKQKVTQYVKCCHLCQKTRGIKVRDRQPMQEMDVVTDYGFSDITVDFLGSKMPMTARKNQYILTIICNSTGWVHAIPMSNCRSSNIADHLLQYFCQVGFPHTIRSDNQFRSEILTAVRDKLGIKARFSAPYHPQSHGRVEKANQTLLQMLKKFVHERPTNWDQELPYLLFALREVPSASSLYSPFELIYGHKARGLLNLLREDWAGEATGGTSWGYQRPDMWNNLVRE